MNLEVRLYASLKDRAGGPRLAVAVEEPVTVRRVMEALARECPALAPALPTALVAVNRDFAFPDTPVQAGDEVALFPPVSGGAPEQEPPYPVYFDVTREPLDVQSITARLTEAGVGAIVFFQGAVRGETEREGLPERTLHLEYEAYEEMALQKMAQIAREIWQQWPLVRGVAIVQRIGKLQVGETGIAIRVPSRLRATASIV
jgi:molybdopterin synthase catalytic subunit